MKFQTLTITNSRSRVIIKCCVIAVAISLMIVATGKISLNEFFNNILEWESI
ncbi:MAG: hypothetical protein K0S44_3418 [Bacteroidetes bacterium]|jgi:hypothetical protein|nr:hypothetical protein [Bacteroidota bacterium]